MFSEYEFRGWRNDLRGLIFLDLCCLVVLFVEYRNLCIVFDQNCRQRTEDHRNVQNKDEHAGAKLVIVRSMFTSSHLHSAAEECVIRIDAEQNSCGKQNARAHNDAALICESA